jgi:glucose-1-phosphate adenylyltransferase
MDYAKMLEQHKAKNADITIAVLDVPKEEASRFGIMTCNEEGRIVKFAEKPKNPDSTLASMGIYIFTWEKLKKYLIEDEANPESENDFGKNIITSMLADKQRLYAYNFEGYWKDVGTIDSLWESNMDLLDPNVPFDVWDKEWKIYSRTLNSPPQYISDKAVVENSMISEGCEVEGTIDFSVLFQNVVIEEGATVKDSIIMPNTVVKKGACIEYAIIGEGCTIEEGAHIGERPEAVENAENWGIAVIGNNLSVCKNAKVGAKAMIYNDVKEEK